ncbi:MAG: CDP-archaeol synthase [Clostridia bacterium]|nr:CDP-archaeol synthase [Clostridia bacterium]
MVKRTLVALPAIALLVATVYFHGLFAKIVISAISVLCMHEMMKVVRTGEDKPFLPIGYAFSALLYPVFEYCGGFVGIAILFALAVMSVMIVLVFSGRNFNDGLMIIFALVYPGMFTAFWIAIFCIPEADTSRFLIAMLFVTATVTDSFAYFCGRLFGRHKLIPRVSPKKTVEGAIGGLVFGTACVTLLGYYLQGVFGLSVAFYWYIVLGLLLSVLMQIGDLSASIIKRRFGVKDYGTFMSGHGGAMDRLDSSLFVSPVIYLFYLIVIL